MNGPYARPPFWSLFRFRGGPLPGINRAVQVALLCPLTGTSHYYDVYYYYDLSIFFS